MLLHQAQNNIGADTHRFRVVCCGRRFGKTTLAIEEMKAFALMRPSKIAYIAPTYQQAKDIAWAALRKELLNVIIREKGTSPLTLWISDQTGKGESMITLRGWESIETLRGQAFDFIVIDEIAMMRNFEYNWQEVIRPTLTDTQGEALFISTPKGFNHFYDLYGKEAFDKDYKSFHYPSYDNPFLAIEEINKAKQELTEDRFAQEYMADFRKMEGLVYKEFNREQHIFEEPGFDGEDFVPVKTFGGVDFGFHNPAVALTIKEDRDKVYWVMNEWYKTEKTDAQIADYVSALKWNECYPDPESPSGIKELENRKVNVREVIKGKDSVRNGISAVREMFKSNRLFIHASCVNLIWELETYAYPDKKPDHNQEENPIKENDHALDALRYALTMVNSSNKSSIVVRRPNSSGWQKRFGG